MNKLLQHVRLLPGRVIVRRIGYGYWTGDIVAGGSIGRRVDFERVEATFQKGKTHYAVVLVRNISSSYTVGHAAVPIKTLAQQH